MWLTGLGRGGSAVAQSVNLQRRKKKERCKWQPKAHWSFEAAIRQHKEFDYQRENRAWNLNEPLRLGESETGGRRQTWQPTEEQLCQEQRGGWTPLCTFLKERNSTPNQNSKTSKPSHSHVQCCRLPPTNHFHYWLTWQHIRRRLHLECIVGIFLLNYNSMMTRVRAVMPSRAPYREICKSDRQ